MANLFGLILLCGLAIHVSSSPIKTASEGFSIREVTSLDTHGNDIKNTLYISNFGATWESARTFCINMLGKKLVSIESPVKNTAVVGAIRATGITTAFWTSGKFDISTYALTWVSTGQKVEYTDWHADSGSAHPYGADFGMYPCLYLWNGEASRNWINYSCTTPLYFVCE